MSLQTRRHFVHDLLGTTAALALANGTRGAPAAKSGAAFSGDNPDGFITDVNVYVAQWPFRRVTGDEPASLVSLLKRSGVKRAWAASLEGLLHRDVGGVNLRLVEICQRQTRLSVLRCAAMNQCCATGARQSRPLVAGCCDPKSSRRANAGCPVQA